MGSSAVTITPDTPTGPVTITPDASALQPSTATISAGDQPTTLAGKVGKWAGDLGGDIRYGTGRTAPGRLLKAMGAQPTTYGSGAGEFMASVPLGATRILKGGAELAQSGKRWQGAKDVAGGAMQAAEIPTGFISPEASEGAAELAGKLPIGQMAGGTWGALKGLASHTPVVGPMARGALKGAVRGWKRAAPAEEALEVTAPRLIEQMGGRPVEAITSKPTGRLILSEAEAQAEARQMSLAKKMASQRGMQYAAGIKPN